MTEAAIHNTDTHNASLHIDVHRSLSPSRSPPPPPLPVAPCVSYVCLAEFDILLGSQVSVQYPTPIGIDVSSLACWMLPEGAHLRESDWTVVFISDDMIRDAKTAAIKKEKDKAERKAKREQHQQQQQQQQEQKQHQETTTTGGDGDGHTAEATLSHSPSPTPTPTPTSPPTSPTPSVAVEPVSLVKPASPSPSPSPSRSTSSSSFSSSYCMLSLCRTKMDKHVKRGALVKSLSIVTKYRFYHLFKPLMMLALDDIFDQAGIPLSSVATTSTTATTTTTTQQAEQTTDTHTHAHTEQGSNNSTPHTEHIRDSSCDLAVLNIICSLFSALNSLPVPPSLSSPPSTLQQRLFAANRLRAGISSQHSSEQHTHDPVYLQYDKTSLPIRFPVYLGEDEVLEASLTSLIGRFQEKVMDIYTAVIAEKRVIFLGYQQPANDVCNCVLSSALLISPPLTHTLERCFPYANLVSLDFLSTPGFIAGVTNPIFESRSAWFDLLCNISDGSITMAAHYQQELQSSSSPSGRAALSAIDAAFFTELQHGITLKYGEEWIRCMFRDYTTQIVALTHDQAVFMDNTTKQQQLEAQQYRIKQLLSSHTYQTYKQTLKQQEEEGDRLDPVPASTLSSDVPLPWSSISSAIAQSIRVLQATTVPVNETLGILQILTAQIQGTHRIQQLLTMLPATQGGLLPIALLLFHSNEEIRRQTIELLTRLDADEHGKKAMSALNSFVLMTYYRYAGEAADKDAMG